MTGASPSYARAYYEDACGIFGMGVYYLREVEKCRIVISKKRENMLDNIKR